jgi:uncharacterized protein YfaP (DUF2135 family)
LLALVAFLLKRHHEEPPPVASAPPAAGTVAVEILSPADGARISERATHLTGRASGPGVSLVALEVNGHPQQSPVSPSGEWEADVMTEETTNTIVARVQGSDGGRAEDRATLNNPTAQTPRLRAQLTWDNGNTDVDLYVVTPQRTVVFFGNGLDPASGAELDFDNQQGYGPENITLQRTPPPGDYRILANWFSGDPSAKPNTAVEIFVDGVSAKRATQRLAAPAGQWSDGAPPGTYFVAGVAHVAANGQITMAGGR